MTLNRWLMAAAAAVAALVVSGSFEIADARSRGAGARGFHGGAHARAFSGHAVYGHDGHRSVRRGIAVGIGVGVPLAWGAYSSGYYGGGCRYLRLRAEATGSAYWWDRYHACRVGHDY